MKGFKASGNIFCFGSIIMDISVKCSQFPCVGETKYTPYPYEVTPGGKGANQAVAAARLGGNVKMLGRISTDEYGEKLEYNLKKAGINVDSLIKDEKAKSGVAFVWVNETGQNQIICSPAVNMKNRVEDFENSLEMLQQGDIVIITMEFPVELMTKVIEIVKEKGGFLILDPSGGDYACLTKELCSQIDVVKPNEVEAEFITGIKIIDERDARKALEILEKMGVTYPLISLGEKGVIYKIDGQVIHEKGINVMAVDTTAAGDTFIGAFAARLSRGSSFEEAVIYGNKAAALCVQRQGAQAAIPYADEIL